MNKKARSIIRLGNVQHKSAEYIAERWNMNEKTVQSILDKNPPKLKIMDSTEPMDQKKKEAKELVDNGYTRREVAEMLGISISTIQRAVHGSDRRKKKVATIITRAITEPVTEPVKETKPEKRAPIQTKQSTKSYNVLWGAFTFSKTN
tara:strand:- start:218 stop:661 length:444 start_codon:yes stop_codon:yes gene_type:complete